MFHSFKRRLKMGLWKHGWCYFSTVLAFVLFSNILVIQRNFASLEGENYIDAGGTRDLRKTGSVAAVHGVFLKRKLHGGSSENSIRFIHEDKLRSLLNILETYLENNASPSARKPTDTNFEKYFPDNLLFCDEIRNITHRKYLASGWTKAVYKGLYKGSPVALKTVDLQGQDVSTCVKSGKTHTMCYIRAAKKIIKEIVVLQALANPNVLKVLGFCLPTSLDDNLRVTMVTELGESVDLIKLLQMSWEDRLRVCLDITKIIHFMSATQYGSMSMNDFRRQQFVLVGGVLQLSDVDDTGFEDPTCTSDDDCVVTFSSSNFTQSTRCLNGRCVEYNEKRNIFNAGRHFVTFLLPHGAPQKFQPIIDEVINGYNNLNMTSKQLLESMTRIVEMYKSGLHLNRSMSDHSKAGYKKLGGSDLPGVYDYRCRFSLSMSGCTVSVYDVREAEDLCNSDDKCIGFVMSSKTTWTERTFVHLKNGFSTNDLKYNPDTSFYLKPS